MPIIDLFQAFRTILVICPHCREMMRLSDLHLRFKGAMPKTWLDRHESEVAKFAVDEAGFDEQEEELRKEAREKGRRKVPKLVRKSLYSEFAKVDYNPYDIKVLFHPVDFVVFDGLQDGEKVDEIVFLSKRTSDRNLNHIRKSVASVVKQERYDWGVARVSPEGRIEFEE